MLMFFPVTLAYAIVVQRAMDVRVVIRRACSTRWRGAEFSCCK
jgi:hypothetical protein